MHLAGLRADESAGVAGERMREHVALAHQGHELADVVVRVDDRVVGGGPELAEVYVERNVRLARYALAELDDLQPPARRAADLRVRLHALDDVSVLVDGAHRVVDVDAARTVELWVVVALQAADEVVGYERQHPARRRFGDEVAEAADGHAARPALVDQGRGRRPHPDHVRVESELAGDVLVDVRMGIDHSGDDELARDVDHLRCTAGGERRLDRADASGEKSDIEPSVAPRRGVDDGASPENRVVRGVLVGHVPSSRAVNPRLARCRTRSRRHGVPPNVRLPRSYSRPARGGCRVRPRLRPLASGPTRSDRSYRVRGAVGDAQRRTTGSGLRLDRPRPAAVGRTRRDGWGSRSLPVDSRGCRPGPE